MGYGFSRNYKINDVTAIYGIAKVASSFTEDVDVIKERYVIDGKSIMGLMSLDMSKGVKICIVTEDIERANKFFTELEKLNIEVSK